MKLSMNDPRYRVPAQIRKIGGKLYSYLDLGPTKAEAEKRAEHWRSMGYSARLTKWRGKTAVYVRKGK